MSLAQYNQRMARMFGYQSFPIPAVSGSQVATVVSSTATEVTINLAIDGWEGVALTANYQAVPGAEQPPAGTQCHVIFAGNDMNNGFVIGFLGWP